MITAEAAAPTASALPAPPTVPAHARALAARLAALFETDREIVERLNDAHHRLSNANDRLWSDPPHRPARRPLDDPPCVLRLPVGLRAAPTTRRRRRRALGQAHRRAHRRRLQH